MKENENIEDNEKKFEKKTLKRYADLLITTLFFIVMIIGSIAAGGLFFGFLAFGLIIMAIVLIVNLFKIGKENTCEKCGMFHSIRKEPYSTSNTVSKSSRYYTENKSEQVGYVRQYGSLLPNAKIYETRNVQHKETIYHNQYPGYCICCGHKQPFNTHSKIQEY